MNITPISADVRIVNYGSPFKVAENIVVEQRTSAPGEPEQWARAWGANEMSNDFAYTEASRFATTLASKVLTAGSAP